MNSNINIVSKKGFTILELLVVMGIMAVVGAAMTIALLTARTENELDAAVNSIVVTLRDARQRAMTQEEGSEWRVRFDRQNGSFQLLKNGNPYGAERALKPSLEFGDRTSELEVWFATSTGVPVGGPVAATVKFRGATCPDEQKCKTVNVNKNGMIAH